MRSLLPTIALVACTTSVRADVATTADDGVTAADGGGSESAGTTAVADDGDDTADDGLKLDVGNDTDSVPCNEGGCDDTCAVPKHEPCDADSDDPRHAMAIECPGELVTGATVKAADAAQGVRTGFGSTDTWAPREGSKFAVLGSGVVAELDTETPTGDQSISPTYCNDDIGPTWDVGNALPAPLMPKDVAGDCAADSSLVGTGDCSKSIQKQFSQGVSANDYAEIRMQVVVPDGAKSFSYDFAFFSVEYPFYYFSEFNDMYVGWLDSENWTGNISFDEYGNPISLNASFLDFRDDAGTAAELEGTCMRSHAGTNWLSTNAPVEPGEEVTIVFAIFDLSDSILDSYVFLDNFQWGCEGGDHPETKPVG
jgi:hypothetical protein